MPGPTPDSMHDRKVVSTALEQLTLQISELRGLLAEGDVRDVFAAAIAFVRIANSLSDQMGGAVSGIANEEYGPGDGEFMQYTTEKSIEYGTRWLDAQVAALDAMP